MAYYQWYVSNSTWRSSSTSISLRSACILPLIRSSALLACGVIGGKCLFPIVRSTTIITRLCHFNRMDFTFDRWLAWNILHLSHLVNRCFCQVWCIHALFVRYLFIFCMYISSFCRSNICYSIKRSCNTSSLNLHFWDCSFHLVMKLSTNSPSFCLYRCKQKFVLVSICDSSLLKITSRFYLSSTLRVQ